MTKDKVLACLINSQGRVSGESISRALGISRAAVNASVRQLRLEGYGIDSSTKTGYELSGSPDRLCAGELMARLGEEYSERIICLNSVGSTNDYLKALAHDGAASGTAVLANEQTAGRGRLGRSFFSPQDEGIYLSLLLRPEIAVEAAPQITAWAAAAIRRAVRRVTGLKPGIKWVNDIVSNGRKLCGILTEMSVEGESGRVQYLIVGCGVNVGQRSFPDELGEVATSLYLETGNKVSRCALAAEMIRQLDAMSRDFPQKKAAYLEEYREACVTLGRDVSYRLDGREHTGRAESIGEDFSLLVRRADGSEDVLRSGEVSVRGLYGYV